MRDVLITAGATRNPIDAMRFISAHSTGRTGARLAEALCGERCVTILGSPEALTHSPNMATCEAFSSTQDLMGKMHAWVAAHPDGLVIHTAAVGDYEVEPVDGKIASGQESLTLKLRPTPKIVDAIREWSPTAKVISFKAAPPGTTGLNLEAIAAAQGDRTGSVAVFANVVGQIESDVLIWTREGVQTFDHRAEALEALIAFARSV